MEILEQVIDTMIEGSDHKALKYWLNMFFADHPDMAERRQQRLDHKRNEEKKAKDGAWGRSRCAMLRHASAGRVAPDCEPATCTRRHSRHARHCAIFDFKLEQGTCVLVLEIRMPSPIVAVITHDRTRFETPPPTVHISDPLVESARRAVAPPLLKTCIGRITLESFCFMRVPIDRATVHVLGAIAQISAKSPWPSNVRGLNTCFFFFFFFFFARSPGVPCGAFFSPKKKAILLKVTFKTCVITSTCRVHGRVMFAQGILATNAMNAAARKRVTRGRRRKVRFQLSAKLPCVFAVWSGVLGHLFFAKRSDLGKVHLQFMRYHFRQNCPLGKTTAAKINGMTPTCLSPRGPHLRASEPADSRHGLLDRRYTQAGRSAGDGAFAHSHLCVLNCVIKSAWSLCGVFQSSSTKLKNPSHVSVRCSRGDQFS